MTSVKMKTHPASIGRAGNEIEETQTGDVSSNPSFILAIPPPCDVSAG